MVRSWQRVRMSWAKKRQWCIYSLGTRWSYWAKTQKVDSDPHSQSLMSVAVGCGPRYVIDVTYFALCASQKNFISARFPHAHRFFWLAHRAEKGDKIWYLGPLPRWQWCWLIHQQPGTWRWYFPLETGYHWRQEILHQAKGLSLYSYITDQTPQPSTISFWMPVRISLWSLKSFSLGRAWATMPVWWFGSQNQTTE